MRLRRLHCWNVSISEARWIQERLRGQVTPEDSFDSVRYVAGTDVAFDRTANRAFAAVAVLKLPRLAVVEHAVASLPITFPYIPGFLSFREVPVICEAMGKLSHLPDLILCDGQGYAHPRRFGLACHLGVLTGITCIGVGKSRLLGSHRHLPNSKGHWVELLDRDEVIGAVLRSRKNAKPIFVSTGHRVSLHSAIRFVKRCTTQYRLPETTRQADRLAAIEKAARKCVNVDSRAQ